MVDGGFNGSLWTTVHICQTARCHRTGQSPRAKNLNSTPAQLMLPATQRFAARRDVRNEKTSFNPVPSKADRIYRSDFKKLWAVYLGRNTLHIKPFCNDVLKIAITWLMLRIGVLIHFSCYCKYIFIVGEIQQIDQLGDNTTEIKHRISQTRKATNALNSIWWHKNITKNRKLYTVKPVLNGISRDQNIFH